METVNLTESGRAKDPALRYGLCSLAWTFRGSPRTLSFGFVPVRFPRALARGVAVLPVEQVLLAAAKEAKRRVRPGNRIPFSGCAERPDQHRSKPSAIKGSRSDQRGGFLCCRCFGFGFKTFLL